MSIALAIVLIVAFDVALLALLTFVMAQVRHLTPHVHRRAQLRELRSERERQDRALAA